MPLCGLLCALIAAAPEADLLLWYRFDEGRGDVAADAAGGGLDGRVGAAWTDSPAGGALSLDGTAASVVRVQVPDDRRLGTGSWTFSAWIKPFQLQIDDPQNQRRLFAYGPYPDAHLVIDISGDGRPMWYFCYRNEGGTITSTGGSAGARVALGEWAHLVLVTDRERRRVTCYLNGFSQGDNEIPAGFTGDFSLGGELTLGAGWHNYWGDLDEVKLWRRALEKSEVKDEFARMQDAFGVELSAEAAAAERREALELTLDSARQAWGRDLPAVRAACGEVIQTADAPPHFRSYAHLLLAQSHQAAGDRAAAMAEYLRIAATEFYPEVHRAEARECAAELARLAAGRPRRDPTASRTSVPRIREFAAEVHVAPDGDDTADGSAAAPVAGLTRARDRVRELRAAGVAGPIGVIIAAGEYPVTGPLELTAEDSGTAGGPVVYRAAEPGAARFYGGQRIGGFAPVTDAAVLARLPEEARGRVQVCDLRAQGMDDYGELAVRGFGQPPSPPTLELFVDGRPMTLARWPNSGFVGIRRLVEPGSKPEGRPAVIEYDDERHARWVGAPDGWLFGYFHFLWADATIRIGSIDPAARTLTTAAPYDYGGRGMDTGQGIQYYAFNLLEELDEPGEWYLDRAAGRLYLDPPTELAGATVEIGLLSTPMVTMTGVSEVRLEGLVFDLARYNALELRDCSHCLIAGCTVSRFAGNGIMVHGGEGNGLLGCDIHTIGRRASEVIGGDRATLTPGGHFVENCRIHDFGRIDRTYTPAIQLEGVGNRVAHNLMYDCPSSVMRIEGNDHRIEFNEVHSAVRESDDQGAMELFMNATYRGVVFRHNRFTNCGKTGREAAVHGQAAIRLDDAISGMVVYGNIFIRSANGNFGAIQFNSGRDNLIDNNLFIDCKQAVSGGWNPGNSVWRMLREGTQPAGFILSDLYLARYPELATMLDEPGINHLWRNLFHRCGRVATGNRSFLDLFANQVSEEGELVEPPGYRPIPADEIGLYQDEFRASWPVETTPVEVPDWRAGG